MVRPIKRLLRLLWGLCEMYSKILLRELKRRSLETTALGSSDARAEVRLSYLLVAACCQNPCQRRRLSRVVCRTPHSVDEAIPT